MPEMMALRALTTLAMIDYDNAVVERIDLDAGRTAEQWARAILEDAPAATRADLTTAWTRLGLQLGPDGADGYVLGWHVRDSAPDYVLLGADSRRGLRAELLVRIRAIALTFASFIQLGNDDARARWATVEEMHPKLMRRLLEEAVARKSAGQP